MKTKKKTKKMKREDVGLTEVEDAPILMAKRDIKEGETVEVKMGPIGKIGYGYLESKDFKPFKIPTV